MKKIILSFIALPALCSCVGVVNGVYEFGRVDFCADYFLKDYTNFFYYNEKDYARVYLASNEVKKGENIGALNGKTTTSYKFFEFANYEEPEFLVVEFVNRLGKKDATYLYASKDCGGVPDSLLANGKTDEYKVTINETKYIVFGDTFQPIEKNEESEAGKIDSISFYEVPNYPNWIFKENDDCRTLYYKEGIEKLDIDVIWLVADDVVHE